MTITFILSLASLLISVSILLYFYNFKRHLKEIEYPFEVEERILELLGKFKHVASIKLEMLEKKVGELKQITKEANDIYASLNVLIADINRLKNDLKDLPSIEEEKRPIERNKQVESLKLKDKTKDVKEDDKTIRKGKDSAGNKTELPESNESLERKILMLNEEGMNDLDIARKLGIGVGEVKLIVELFKGQKSN